jgi:hypothetical protein
MKSITRALRPSNRHSRFLFAGLLFLSVISIGAASHAAGSHCQRQEIGGQKIPKDPDIGGNQGVPTSPTLPWAAVREIGGETQQKPKGPSDIITVTLKKRP